MYKPVYSYTKVPGCSTCCTCGAIICTSETDVRKIHDDWHEKMDKLFERMAAEEERERLRDEMDKCECGVNELIGCSVHTVTDAELLGEECLCYSVAGDSRHCPTHGY